MARTRQPGRTKDYIVAALLSLALVWLLYLVFNIARKEEIARHAAEDTRAQLLTLQQRENTLQQNINDLSTERGQEATLRQTYGVAKPGEQVIIVVPPKEAASTTPPSFWQKTFGWLVFWKKTAS
jgi:cell division protein FtsB